MLARHKRAFGRNETTQWWVLNERANDGAFGRDCPREHLARLSRPIARSPPREAAQAGSTTIVEAKAVEARKGDGRETDTTRERETETGSMTQTAQEIETGIVVATGTESTRKRGGPASPLFMSIS